MKMSNKTYDILKWVALVVLDAVATLVNTLGDIWGIPHAAQVASTLTAVGVCLGVCLQISSANYKELNYDEETEEEIRNDIEE